MEDFQAYSPEDVIYANLRESAQRMDLLCEQDLAHLRELAYEIALGIRENNDFIASLPDRRPPKNPQAFKSTPNLETLNKWHDFLEVWKSVMLCTEIRKQLSTAIPLLPEYFFGDTDTVADTATGRIAYQRSNYADEAFLRFTSVVSTARSVYAHSFLGACEEVYNGLCEFCILPIESSSEGPLSSFSRLIDRYGLKIAAICDITATDGSRTTRFALLRKSLLPLLGDYRVSGFLEIAAIQNESPSPAGLLTAAELCGLPLLRADSRPQTDGDNQQSVMHYLFRADRGDLTSYLLYLAMEAPHYEAMGLYTQVTESQKYHFKIKKA